MNTTQTRRPAVIQHDLAVARQQTTPMDADLRALMATKPGMAERIAQMDAEVAVIAATIPALKTELAASVAHFNCHRCEGSGEYLAPTSHYREGRPVCFSCNGSGRKAE